MSTSCPKISPDMSVIDANSVTNMAKAVGATTCRNDSKNSQTSNSTAAEISASIMGLANANGNFTNNYSNVEAEASSIGCEQLAIMASQFDASSKKIACLIGSDSTSISTDLKSINSINFESGGDMTFDDTFDVIQNLKIKYVDIHNLSIETTNAISSEVQNALINSIDTLQESKSGVGSTPQGAKVLSDLKSKVTNETMNTIVNEKITQIKTTVDSANVLQFKSAGRLTFKKGVKINQDLMIDILANTLLSNSIDQVLSSVEKSSVDNATKISQKAENLGVDTLGRQAGDATEKILKAMPLSNATGISGIVGLIIVMFIVYKFGFPSVALGRTVSLAVMFLGLAGVIVMSVLTYFAFSYDKRYETKADAWKEKAMECLTIPDDKKQCDKKDVELEKYEPYSLGTKIIYVLALILSVVMLMFGINSYSKSEKGSSSENSSSSSISDLSSSSRAMIVN